MADQLNSELKMEEIIKTKLEGALCFYSTALNGEKKDDKKIASLEDEADCRLNDVLACLKEKMSSEEFRLKYPQVNASKQYALAERCIKHRFNRLKRMIVLDAPGIIIGNELRMLRETIDNPLNGKFIEES